MREVSIDIGPISAVVALRRREQRPHPQQRQFVKDEAGVSRNSCEGIYGDAGLVEVRGTPTAK